MVVKEKKNKLSKRKKRWVITILSGLGLSLIVLILEFILFFTCSDNLLCFGLLVIPTLPGVVLSRILGLNLEKYSLIFFSLIIWFLIGSIIGFLVLKNKSKKK